MNKNMNYFSNKCLEIKILVGQEKTNNAENVLKLKLRFSFFSITHQIVLLFSALDVFVCNSDKKRPYLRLI